MPAASPPTKKCPRCRSILAMDAENCACGHHFDPITDAAAQSSEPSLTAQAEALYESLLRARLERARRVVRFAKVEVLRDPGNTEKMNQLRAVEREVHLLEAQLAVQAARAAQARAAAQQPTTDDSSAELSEIASDVPKAFRQAQAAKANETLELLQRQAAEDALNAKRANSVFNAVQIEKARKIAEQLAPPTCPACGEAVTSDTVRCNCGYILITTDATQAPLSVNKPTTPRK